MYLFINESTIVKYNGEILKRYIGNKLVKTISNPTDEQLLEFGYMPLDNTAEMPEIPDGYVIQELYTVEDNKIIKRYELINEKNTPVEVAEETEDEI